MKISEMYGQSEPLFSIEVFPPKNGCSLESLILTVEKLKRFKPAFVSITCGALGNARGGTNELATRIRHKYGIETMAHLTCMSKSKQELENLLVGMSYAEINNVLALRGDPQQDKTPLKGNEHSYAYQLVQQISQMNKGEYLSGNGKKTEFSIGVACYPEGHKDNPTKSKEPLYLKIKQDAGAEFAITQMFFDNEKYFRFVESSHKKGVAMPIVPGIMPIKDAGSIEFFKKTFGAEVPDELKRKMRKYPRDKEYQTEMGAEHALNQCEQLLRNGAPGIHFYTMNRPETIEQILIALKNR